MAKVIFRNVGGRIIPIIVEKAANIFPWGKEAAVTAKVGGKTIAEMSAIQNPLRPARFEVMRSHIAEAYRGQGLGSEFYAKLADQVRKLGGKALEGTTQNPAVIAVRKKIGPTKVQVRPTGYAKVWTWLGKKRNK